MSSQRTERPAFLTLCNDLLLAVDEKSEVLVFYQRDGHLLLFLDMMSMTAHTHTMPHDFRLGRVFFPSISTALLENANDRKQLLLGHWRVGSNEKVKQRWTLILRSPIAHSPNSQNLARALISSSFPTSPSTLPTHYDFMSTNTQPTFLVSSDANRQVPTCADYVEPALSSALLALPRRGANTTFVVYSIPRLAEPDTTRDRTFNERSLYLRRSQQLLTLTYQRNLQGTEPMNLI